MAHSFTAPPGAPLDPGSFNAWLRTHGGYEGDNNLEEGAVPAINPAHVQWNETYGMHRTNDVPFAAVTALLREGA